uniref:Putative ovule protein n=1 Tax=Solanum chacoense TaxID=4108 RepID=A0A0V0I0H2_SOLCH
MPLKYDKSKTCISISYKSKVRKKFLSLFKGKVDAIKGRYQCISYSPKKQLCRNSRIKRTMLSTLKVDSQIQHYFPNQPKHTMPSTNQT